MAAPTVDLAVFGTDPNEYATETSLEALLNGLSAALWTQMHALLGRVPIGTFNTEGSANAITVRVASVYADVARDGGAMFFIRPEVDTTSADVTLSVEMEPAYPVKDAAGQALPAGALRAGEWNLVRKSGAAPNWEYWLVMSETDLWAQAARGDIIDTVNVTGGPNDVSFRVPSGLASRTPLGLGCDYRIRFPADNTGAMRLRGEDLVWRDLLDPDGNACAPRQVRAGRLYEVRDAGSEASRHYRILDSVLTQRDILALEAGGGGGGSGVAEERAHVEPYMVGDVLHAAGDDVGVVADLGGLTLLGEPRGGRYVSVIVDDPDWGPRLLGGHPAIGGYLIPSAPKVLEIVPSTGQSLDVGAQSADTLLTLAQEWPLDALMFDRASNADVRMGLDTANEASVLNPADLTGFRALVARAGVGAGERGETPLEGFARRLTRLARRGNIQRRMLCFTAGVGGTGYSGLKKGTQAYANLLAAVGRGAEIADANGWRVEVPGVPIKHGESDQSNSGYLAALQEWREDLDADIRALLGQAAPVHFFLGQSSSFSVATDAALAVAEAIGPYIHVVGPDYPWRADYADDLVHYEGPGYQKLGEMFALAWADVFWRPAPRQPGLRITGGSRTGLNVSLTYSVPAPPLVIDAADNPGQWGFRVWSGSTELTVTACAVTAGGVGTGVGTVQLNLASAPAGALRVEYATRLRTPSTGVPRGCLRDSNPERSQHDNAFLRNWAIHQRRTV